MQRGEGTWTRLLLIAGAMVVLGLFLVLPLVGLWYEALRYGLLRYWRALQDEQIWVALRLSLLIASIGVALNTLFALSMAWLVTKYHFWGKSFWLTLLDLPLSVSPVVAGFLYVILFGRHGLLGPWLLAHDVQIIFALPGMILATMFVTFPLVARELIALMHNQGCGEELAAWVLGANGWQMFWRVTLPNIKWGLLYGIVLCGARAMGEFGAVSVVSGHIRGKTNTLPLHIEALYQEYDFGGAFAAASLLTLLAALSWGLQTLLRLRRVERGHSS